MTVMARPQLSLAHTLRALCFILSEYLIHVTSAPNPQLGTRAGPALLGQSAGCLCAGADNNTPPHHPENIHSGEKYSSLIVETCRLTYMSVSYMIPSRRESGWELEGMLE